MGTTDDYETLRLSLESQEADLSNKAASFFVIKTDGWSFDSIEELSETLKAASKLRKLPDFDTPKLTAGEFASLMAVIYGPREEHLRLGQHAFGQLQKKSSLIADQLRGTLHDPFNQDERMPAFISKLASLVSPEE